MTGGRKKIKEWRDRSYLGDPGMSGGTGKKGLSLKRQDQDVQLPAKAEIEVFVDLVFPYLCL